MSRHAIYVGPGGISEPLTEITGPEAEHAAKAKRARPGDAVALLDGAGTIANATLTEVRKSRVVARVESIQCADPVRPGVEVWGATPKGPRLEKMLDMLAQAGAASWHPLNTRHGVVDPGEGKHARAERIAIEALKQCGRAWLMRIEDKGELAEALSAPAGTAVVLADSTGEPYRRTGAPSVRLLIGPEGGWHEQELDAARRAGAIIASFGPHAMRIETAAVIGTGIIVNAEAPGR